MFFYDAEGAYQFYLRARRQGFSHQAALELSMAEYPSDMELALRQARANAPVDPVKKPVASEDGDDQAKTDLTG